MRFYITKKSLVVIIGILSAALIALAMTGCIPVTVRPEFDDENKPIPLAVTPVGQVTPEGELVPVFETSNKPPAPPADWTDVLEQLGTLAAGLLLGGGAAVPLISRAKTALRIACNLADAHAATAEKAAHMDPHEAAEALVDIERNKQLARQEQVKAGVVALVQKVRGK